MTATELYVRPLRTRSFCVGEITFPLDRGILATLTLIRRHDPRAVLKAAKTLIPGLTKGSLAQAVMVAYAQIAWYQAKGADVPASVTRTYETALGVAQMSVNAEPPKEEPAPSHPESPSMKSTPPLRPKQYCRQLIDAGEHDPAVLFAAVVSHFGEERVGKFKVADVMWQLREADVLPRSKRYRGDLT